MRQTKIFVILGLFLPLQPPDNLENQNFKIKKNTWRYYHLTHLHHKWQSYDIWFLRYGPPHGPRKSKIKILKNWKKHLKISSFYKWVPWMIVIWHMVPEIWSATDIIFCHFGPFFALLPPKKPHKSKFRNTKENTWRYYHFTHVYHDNHMIYGSWDIESNSSPAYLALGMRLILSVMDRFFLSLWTIFALLPHKNPINQNFEKMTKTHGDIIISYMCTINDNHMIFGSWDIECNRQIVLSFWMVFCPSPPTTLKIKISKKWKNHLKIPSFYKSVPKIMIIWYTVREIWHVMDIIVIFHFGLIFALLTP